MTIVLNKSVAPNAKKLQKYIEQINGRNWFTNFGPLHQELTERLEAYLGVKRLLLVYNGTVALQVAYKALNVRHAVTTPFSFIATTSSLQWQGHDVSFADIDGHSLNMCPTNIEKALTENTQIDSIVATHVFGNPCEVDQIASIARSHNKRVIYDAAHAFGVKIHGESVLTHGDASTLSFHATKVFHTVEGGAIVFKDVEKFERAKRLINFGIDTSNGAITEPGINGKLNEYQCAVGLTILDEMDSILDHRLNLFSTYRQELESVVDMPSWLEGASKNGAYMPILLESEERRTVVMEALTSSGIQSRKYFSPSLNTLARPHVSMPVSEDIASRILCLPLHYYMTSSDVKNVSDTIKGLIK